MTASRTTILTLILATFGCAGKSASSGALPADPVAVIEQFLAAVKANDLGSMGDLWGSSRGPANDWMDGSTREKALTVIRATLAFESYVVDPAGTRPGASDRERVLRVQLRRNNCQPTVPFTTLRVGEGWLVSDIDLAAAGNPRRPCS